MAVKQHLIKSWLPQISPSFTLSFGAVDPGIIPVLKTFDGAVPYGASTISIKHRNHFVTGREEMFSMLTMTTRATT